MARKLIAYNLLVIVLLCTLQVGVTTHYCCGNLIGSKFILGDGKVSCGMKPEENVRCDHKSNFNRGCCEDFQAKFQFHEDFDSPVYSIAERTGVEFVMPLIFEKIAASITTPYIAQYLAIKAPPDLSVSRESLSLLQVFRI